MRAAAKHPSHVGSRRRLHLPQPVEVAHVGGGLSEERHDDVACDELHEKAHDRARRPEAAAGGRPVVAVTRERLEGLDGVPVRRQERIRARERSRTGQLSEHLALPRAADLDVVEEARDGCVVLAQEAQAFDRVVELLEVGSPARHGRTVSPLPALRPAAAAGGCWKNAGEACDPPITLLTEHATPLRRPREASGHCGRMALP